MPRFSQLLFATCVLLAGGCTRAGFATGDTADAASDAARDAARDATRDAARDATRDAVVEDAVAEDAAPVPSCSDASDPDAYCQAQHGPTHFCRADADGLFRCVALPCADDRDCAWLDGQCQVGRCQLTTHACTTELLSAGSECDDGLFCTATDRCDATGTCVGSANNCAGPCIDRCDETTDACIAAVATTGCNDGFDCTTTDQCDGAGHCVGTPDNSRCPISGDVCQPGWFGGSTGCGGMPNGMSLVCQSPVATGAAAACTVVLDNGAAAQAAAISCEVKSGLVVVAAADFADRLGDCALDGWEIVSGSACSSSVAAGCVPGGSAACCDQFATICGGSWRRGELISDFDRNCGGGFRQWQLRRTFDLHQVEAPRLCYDVGEAYAIVADAVFVQVNDATNSALISCVQGDIKWRGGSQTVCTDLPTWAALNASVTVTITAHADASGGTDSRHMSLDNVVLYGWRPGCTQRSRQIVLTEDWVGCPNPISDGWNGWTVTGAPVCNAAVCAGSGSSVEVSNGGWSVDRVVDTSALSGDLQLCLSASEQATTDTDRISVRINIEDGTGWHTVGSGSPYAQIDLTCRPVCFGLDNARPGAAHNPRLGIELSLDSATSGRVIADHLELTGLASCDAAAEVVLGAIDDLGGGAYRFTATDVGGTELQAEVICRWNGAPPALAATAVVWFE